MKKIFVYMFLIFYGMMVLAEDFDSELEKGITPGMHHEYRNFNKSVVNNSGDEYTYQARLVGSKRIHKSSVTPLDPEMTWSKKKYNEPRTKVIFEGSILPTNKDYYCSCFEGEMTAEEGGSGEADLTWDFTAKLNAQKIQLFVFGENSDIEGASALPAEIANYFRGEKSRNNFGIGEKIYFFAFLDGKPYPLSKDHLVINTNEIIPDQREWENIERGSLQGVRITLKLGNSLKESENQEPNSNRSFHRRKKMAVKVEINGKNIVCPSITIHYPYVYFDSESVYPQLDENGNIVNPFQYHQRLLNAINKPRQYIEQEMIGSYFVVNDYLGPDVADFRNLFVREESCDGIVTGFIQSSPHSQGICSNIVLYEAGKGCCGDNSNDLVYHYMERNDFLRHYSYENELSASAQWNIPWVIAKTDLDGNDNWDRDDFFQISSEIGRDDSSIVFAFLKQTFTQKKNANSSSVKCRVTKLGISREYDYTFE